MTKKRSNVVRLLLCLMGYGTALSAQELPSIPSEENASSRVQLYIDCDDCYQDFVRRSLPFASFVRDPQLADVYILVTRQGTGGGGGVYRMEFMGRKAWEDQRLEIYCRTEQGDTDDAIRTKLLQSLRVGLAPFAHQVADVQVDITEKQIEEENVPTNDPWKRWVFRVDLEGSFDLEERRKEYRYEGELAVRKITSAWKLEAELEVNYEERRFRDDGDILITSQDDRELEGSWVKSLSDHWSTGVRAEVSSSTFTNIQLGTTVFPAIEYNVYPWDESHIREFTLAYYIGVRSFDYFEETIFFKQQETLLSESIRLNMQFIRPWGELEAEVEASHYFKDFSKNRVVGEFEIGYRITRGLLLTAELEVQRIRDQLYLEKGGASLEDLLLEQRKVKTNYDISGSLGIRFVFGSVYNDIVNPRL